MDRKQIIETIQTLAMSKGFYGRLLDTIMMLEDSQYEEVMQVLEEQNFKDTLDLIFYFEC